MNLRTVSPGSGGNPNEPRTKLTLAMMASNESARVPSKSNRTARGGMLASGLRSKIASYGKPTHGGGWVWRMDRMTETTEQQPLPPTPEVVFREYAPRIYHLARRMLNNDADAEDVTSEVLM